MRAAMTARSAALSIAVLLAAGSAEAEERPFAGKSVLVMPVAGAASDSERDALSAAAVRGAQAAGASAELAQSSAFDLIAIHGCGSSDWDCLATIPETLAVDVVVFSTIRGSGEERVLYVTWLEAGGDRGRGTIALEGDVEARVEPGLQGLLTTGEVPVAEDGDAGGESGEGGDAADLEVKDPAAGDGEDGEDAFGYGTRTPARDADLDFDFSRVEPWAWAIGGGGVGAAIVGAIVLTAGDGVQSDIDEAPTDTADDLDRLADLEGDARLLYGVGNTLVIGGMVATGVGAALIFIQARRDSSSPSVSLAPAPSGSGAMLTLGVRR